MCPVQGAPNEERVWHGKNWITFINNCNLYRYSSLEIQISLIYIISFDSQRELEVNLYWLRFMAEETEAHRNLVIYPYFYLASSWTLNPVFCLVLFPLTSRVHALSCCFSHSIKPSLPCSQFVTHFGVITLPQVIFANTINQESSTTTICPVASSIIKL